MIGHGGRNYRKLGLNKTHDIGMLLRHKLTRYIVTRSRIEPTSVPDQDILR
jgi:hypothetical protein